IVYGNLLVSGNKSFVEPHPSDPNKMVADVALEGPEAGTYFRGSGRIVDGIATIQVPEDFRIVTDEKGLTIQVTPIGEPSTIWCVRKSLDTIELRGTADVGLAAPKNSETDSDHWGLAKGWVEATRSWSLIGIARTYANSKGGEKRVVQDSLRDHA